MPIIILDESVANKIAAGEVVERPASVVKELVENSLDAGAGRIEIELEQSGRKLICVTDDGAGMSRDDAVLALQRHATSKIKTAEDLNAIHTLGFRGEALPSIAAVCDLRMVTHPRSEENGTELVVQGGVITELRDTGAPPGTQIAVHQLFYNTPARLKFLRSESTELGHICELLTRFTLSHHEVHFRLTHNGREVLVRPPCAQLAQSVATLYGREIFQRLLPVELSAGGVRITGFVSSPELARGSRSQETFIINRRWVRSKLLLHALEDAYRAVLSAGRYPIAVLMIELDPHLVDVNVHPAKAEVRFSREGEMHQLVSRAVREALGGKQIAAVERQIARSSEQADQVGLPMGEGRPGAQTRLPVSLPPPSQPSEVPEGLIPVGQVRATYVIAESDGGVVLIDQHRAHERILYERLMRAQASGRVDSQRLAIPASLHLSPVEAATLGDYLEPLTRLGFELESLGTRSYLVRAVPALLIRMPVEELVRDLLEELASQPAERSVDQRSERLLVSMACHSAIKAGQPLALAEMSQLLSELLATQRPHTCPHGAPVVITWTRSELDRKFRR